MFKTILNNLLSIYKPRVNNDNVMVNIKVIRKGRVNYGDIALWNTIDWHIFKLPGHDQSITINDIKIKAEIVE